MSCRKNLFFVGLILFLSGFSVSLAQTGIARELSQHDAHVVNDGDANNILLLVAITFDNAGLTPLVLEKNRRNNRITSCNVLACSPFDRTESDIKLAGKVIVTQDLAKFSTTLTDIKSVKLSTALIGDITYKEAENSINIGGGCGAINNKGNYYDVYGTASEAEFVVTVVMKGKKLKMICTSFKGADFIKIQNMESRQLDYYIKHCPLGQEMFGQFRFYEDDSKEVLYTYSTSKNFIIRKKKFLLNDPSKSEDASWQSSNPLKLHQGATIRAAIHLNKQQDSSYSPGNQENTLIGLIGNVVNAKGETYSLAPGDNSSKIKFSCNENDFFNGGRYTDKLGKIHQIGWYSCDPETGEFGVYTSLYDITRTVLNLPWAGNITLPEMVRLRPGQVLILYYLDGTRKMYAHDGMNEWICETDCVQYRGLENQMASVKVGETNVVIFHADGIQFQPGFVRYWSDGNYVARDLRQIYGEPIKVSLRLLAYADVNVEVTVECTADQITVRNGVVTGATNLDRVVATEKFVQVVNNNHLGGAEDRNNPPLTDLGVYVGNMFYFLMSSESKNYFSSPGCFHSGVALSRIPIYSDQFYSEAFDISKVDPIIMSINSGVDAGGAPSAKYQRRMIMFPAGELKERTLQDYRCTPNHRVAPFMDDWDEYDSLFQPGKNIRKEPQTPRVRSIPLEEFSFPSKAIREQMRAPNSKDVGTASPNRFSRTKEQVEGIKVVKEYIERGKAEQSRLNGLRASGANPGVLTGQLNQKYRLGAIGAMSLKEARLTVKTQSDKLNATAQSFGESLKAVNLGKKSVTDAAGKIKGAITKLIAAKQAIETQKKLIEDEKENKKKVAEEVKTEINKQEVEIGNSIKIINDEIAKVDVAMTKYESEAKMVQSENMVVQKVAPQVAEAMRLLRLSIVGSDRTLADYFDATKKVADDAATSVRIAKRDADTEATKAKTEFLNAETTAADAYKAVGEAFEAIKYASSASALTGMVSKSMFVFAIIVSAAKLFL